MNNIDYAIALGFKLLNSYWYIKNLLQGAKINPMIYVAYSTIQQK